MENKKKNINKFKIVRKKNVSEKNKDGDVNED